MQAVIDAKVRVQARPRNALVGIMYQRFLGAAEEVPRIVQNRRLSAAGRVFQFVGLKSAQIGAHHCCGAGHGARDRQAHGSKSFAGVEPAQPPQDPKNQEH